MEVIRDRKSLIMSIIIVKYHIFLFTCSFPPYCLLDLLFFSSPLFFIPLCVPPSPSVSAATLSHCIAPVSRLPARQCGPGGSNQLNYWEHKNAAANGSWINTLAKLLPRLPLLPQGIKLEILRLRTRRLEATAEALSGAEPRLWHPGRPKAIRATGSEPDSDSCDLLTMETAEVVKPGRPLFFFSLAQAIVTVNI